MKKISAIIAVFLLCLAFPLAALAVTDTPKMVDNAGLLDSAEANEVQAALDGVSEKYDVDIVVLTTNGTDGQDITTFSDTYFLNNGYGTGENRSGVLLVLDMLNRDWHISTHGEGISAFTDYGIQQCGDQITPYLSSGDYSNGFKEYARVADYYFEQERSGSPVDNYNEPAQKKAPGAGTYVLAGVISLLAAFGISFAITGSMKKKMKSVRKQVSASAYADQNGLNLRENTDRYLYHRVVAVPLPKNDSSQGGGSSVHSTGGSSFGGGGGKF